MDTGLEQTLPVEDREQELQALRNEIARLRRAHTETSDAAHAQGSFLAHVSHELRTPMNSVLGMARLTLATELSTEQREFLDVIEESAESLLTLVNDVLDQAKIDAGMLELESISFRLDDLVGSALRAVRIMTDHKGLLLTYDRSPDVPPTVVGDPTRLRQVLLNLVTNAAKFTHAGSIELAIELADGRTAFSVCDSGIGIPADRIDTIFEAFRQADDSTTRRYGGTGLGLSISARLVELMGGVLTVDSKVGEGSTFRFAIELLEGAGPGEATTDPLAAPMGAKVLWLTDDGISRQGAREVVRERGMVPQVVTDVDSAMACLRDSAEAPAVLVVDLHAAALDVAWELGREAAATPIAVITPGGQRGDGARCRSLEIAAYLTGPLVPADVADALDAVLAGVPDLVTRHWLNERRRTLHILIADDSATNRTLLARMLEGRGHQSIQAGDGESVLDVIVSEDIDLLLLDLHMPKLDGYETAAKIRSLPGGAAEIPIIAVSGSVSDAGRERCRQLGIDDFVAKPFRPEHILEVIEKMVGV